MAYYGMSAPNPTNSTQTTSYTFTYGSGINIGDTIYTNFDLSNLNGVYKVGKITLSTDWPGIIKARYRDDDDTGDGTSMNITDGTSFNFYTNWLTPRVWLYFELKEPGPGGPYTVSIKWEAQTNNLATYTVNNYTYTGTQKTGVTNMSGCYPSSGTNVATNAGTYTTTLVGSNTAAHGNAYYFADGITSGTASATKSVEWTISKADQDWVINPSTIYVDSSTVYARVEDNWVGTLSCFVVDSSIATASVNSGSGVITINKVASSGTTIISVSSPGNSNMNARTQTATIIIGSPVTDKPVKIYVNGSWVNAIPYIYHNGSWTKATAYIYSGGQWKETKA